MLDDISVVFNLRSGLVILTGCAHAGICNIIKHSIELTGVDRVKAVIGGFHLAEASEQIIKKTVECLAQYNVDYVAAGHCTGFRAQVELYLEFRDKFTPLYTGILLSFK
jgi:7,8-dihydropterin-6-yl-methyl-4-(beta-D-ribofuranosyl)aminobenzene 5'-phosphate synthase